MGNTKNQDEKSYFPAYNSKGRISEMKMCESQKKKENSSVFLFSLQSALPPRMLITKHKSHCRLVPKKHAANTLCGKQGLQRGFVHLSQPALPYFSVPLAKWKINNSFLAVQVIIGWIYHQPAHPRSEAGKA